MVNPFDTIIKIGRRVAAPIVKTCTSLKAKRPEAFVAVGLIMTAASFVWVAIESSKAPDVMAEGAEELDHLRNMREYTQTSEEIMVIDEGVKPETIEDENGLRVEVPSHPATPEERAEMIKDLDRDIRHCKQNNILTVGKMFAGPAFLFLIGTGMIVGGTAIFRKENLLLAGTVQGYKKFIDFYRGNVIAAEGEEADKRYARGIVGEKTVPKKITDEDGKTKTVKEKVPVMGQRRGNPWQFEFSPSFFYSATGDPDHDLTHLKNVEYYFNKVYNGRKKHGKISMFEVLEYLDPIWEALDADGSVETFCRAYGWGHDKNGDDRIDFGIYRAINQPAIEGIGDAVYIEFNCDGLLADVRNQYRERYVNA